MARSESMTSRDASSRLMGSTAAACEAMAIDRSLDGLDLVAGETLWIEGRRGGGTPPVRTAARVGIGDKGVWTRRRLRWLVRGHPHVSVPAD